MLGIDSRIGERFAGVGDFVRALHADDRGDNENLGRMLILALVLIPLVILIAFFGDTLWTKAKCQWDAVIGDTAGTGGATQGGGTPGQC